MKKIIFTLFTLLLLTSVKTYAQEFEYITPINSEEIKWRPVVYELQNGNFIVTAQVYGGAAANNTILLCLSDEGELLFERNLDSYLGHRFGNFVFIETENNGLFSIGTTSNSTNGYLKFYKFDPSNLEVIYETTHAVDLSSTTEPSKLILNGAIDDNGEGLAISFRKIAPDANPNDSVFFWKLDYEGNIKHTNNLEVRTNSFDPVTNALIRNNSGEGYFYFTNGESFSNGDPISRHFDNNFGLLSQTEIVLEAPRDKTFLDHLDVKQLPDGNFLIGADGRFHEFLVTKLLAFCCEFDEQMQLVDSIAKGPFDETEERRIQNQVPNENCIDFIDENQIFFGFNLDNPGIGTPVPRPKYFMLYSLDRELNTVKEFYYGIKDNSTYLWISDIAATKDGGVICAGHFCDFVAHNATNYNCFDVTQLVIKKFDSRAFNSIDEAHANNLKVALVYPNPGKNEMLVRTTLENATVELYDLQGKLIVKQSLNDKITTINASEWQSGTYLYKIVQNEKVIESGKWIKE
ncbi:MAG: T9SS type A sorting domain-containing protein [Lentimicrobiaceae bacterium]|jgi:hypothetical protein|nr:T9SS type A sorting domain-containing protein [Lentimicrobiaceae bacterium]